MRFARTGRILAAACCLTLTACTGNDEPSASTSGPQPTLTLGHRVRTAGVGGKGTAWIDPDTVVYARTTTFGAPEHGVFAVVNYRSGDGSEPRVTTTAERGGFRWKTPEGRTVKARNTKAAKKLAPIGFSEGGPVVAPKEWHQDVAVFDIAAAEKGGTLVYVDGKGVAFRWKIPGGNSGTAVPALKFALS
ncbi:hypothetical protein ACOKM5_01230 [Streptomyces sp. BH097]|uniref:hypothetical protein n=1 Tax=unclassified Streptomyces TaxID=2593676 RepID=UPI003BB69A8E